MINLLIKIPLIKKSLIITFSWKIIPTREVWTGGFDSRTEDGMYVIFLDYDEIKWEILLDDLRNLIERFKLSHFYVFETAPDSYHAICLDKFPLKYAQQIIDYSCADYAFKRGAYLDMSRCWTLRTMKDYRPKPKYIGIVESPYCEYEQSSAHAEFLRRYYGVPVELKKPDNLEHIWFEKYMTKRKAKRGGE